MKMSLNSSIATASESLTRRNETDSKSIIVLRICKRNSLPPTATLNFTEFYSENFLSARTHLNWFIETNSNVPDLIIIDLPFVRREVKNFSEWLAKSVEFSRIPLVYSNTFVGVAELKELI